MDEKFLKEHYEERKEIIKERLSEFASVPRNDERIFEEMCFCIFTANASARMGMNSIEKIKPVLMTATQEDMASLLKGVYRFPNKRSEYIIYNRERLKDEHDFKLAELLESFDDPEELRDFIVNEIKGLGYKEASHFLRNIGYSNLCILDKHILTCLNELGIIPDNIPPKNRKEYIETERKLRLYSEDIGIDIDEMDLLLWSIKTGEILK